MSSFKVFDIAGSGMAAQSVRLNTVASNLANAESVSGDAKTAYKARHPVFEAVRAQAGASQNGVDPGAAVKVLGIVEDQRAPEMRYQPGNPLANSEGYVFAPNVNVVEEMVDMISASRAYQNNVEVMNTSKELLMATLRLGELIMAVNAVSASQSPTTSLGVEKKDQLGQKQFMQLMIAQLQNQDPTQPADPSAFLSQLAQFGTVSGIQSMQDSLSTLSDSLRSSQVLGGTNMVGHYVLADSSDATLDSTGEVAGAATIPEGATEASVVITDASGQLVRQMPISAQQGESDFLWDGTTDLGTRAPAGNYKVQTFAKVGGASEELTTQLVGHVGSVSIDPNNNSLTLNTDLGPISLSRVRRVM